MCAWNKGKTSCVWVVYKLFIDNLNVYLKIVKANNRQWLLHYGWQDNYIHILTQYSWKKKFTTNGNVFNKSKEQCMGDNTYRMCASNVLQHVIHGAFGWITFSVVTPTPSSCLCRQSRTICQTTTQRFVAVCICPFLVIWIKMCVWKVQHLECGYCWLKKFQN